MSETNSAPAENSAAPASAPVAASKSNTPMLLGVLVVVAVLIAAGVGAFMMMNKEEDSDSNDEASESRDREEDEEEDNEDEEVEEDEDEDSRESRDDEEDEDDDSASSNSGICELLTQDEAAEILGGDVTEGEEDEVSCTYSLDSLSSIGVLYFSINEESFGSSAEDQYDIAKESLYSDAVEVDVDGADEAVWSAGWMQLSVLKDDKWIIVSSLVTSDDEDSGKDASVEAAEIIVDRL